MNPFDAIRAYCRHADVPVPEIITGKLVNRVAQAHPTRWAIIARENPSPWVLGHELAHLIVRRTARGDSLTHGPLFQLKSHEIESFIRDLKRTGK